MNRWVVLTGFLVGGKQKVEAWLVTAPTSVEANSEAMSAATSGERGTVLLGLHPLAGEIRVREVGGDFIVADGCPCFDAAGAP